MLINNAGGPPAGTFEKFDDQDWQKAFELNLLSFIRTIREALPYMKNNHQAALSTLRLHPLNKRLITYYYLTRFERGLLAW